jgi:hypothetical protein
MTPNTPEDVSDAFLWSVIELANDYDNAPPKNGPYYLTFEAWKLRSMAREIQRLRLRHRAENRWVPVSERLPTVDDSTCTSNQQHAVLCWHARLQARMIDHWSNVATNKNYTAWRALPPPYVSNETPT